MTHRLFLSSFAILGTVTTAISYFLILPTADYHFQQVILNFYENHPTDFSVDVTGLVRGLGAVALACMVLGLALGSVIGLGNAGKQQKESHFAPNTKIDAALLRSGLVSGVATSEGVKFELTDKGREFMKEYEQAERELRNRTPKITVNPECD